MAFSPNNIYEADNGMLIHSFLPKASTAITKYQLVIFDSSDDTIDVCGATAANAIGIALETRASTASPTNADRVKVAMFGSRAVPMIGNGTITRGSKLITAASGKVTNAGATPDARNVVGIALNSDATDGNYVCVLLPLGDSTTRALTQQTSKKEQQKCLLQHRLFTRTGRSRTSRSPTAQASLSLIGCFLLPLSKT